jgi:hypothetical protein
MRPGVAHVLGICAVPGTAGASPAVSVIIEMREEEEDGFPVFAVSSKAMV